MRLAGQPVKTMSRRSGEVLSGTKRHDMSADKWGVSGFHTHWEHSQQSGNLPSEGSPFWQMMCCAKHTTALETLLTISLHAAQEAAAASACAINNLAAACCQTRQQNAMTLSLCLGAAASAKSGPCAVRLHGNRPGGHLYW